MRTVFRYPIVLTEASQSELEIAMPEGAEVLKVDVSQRPPHNPSVWALVDTDRPSRPRRFRVLGTGDPFEDEPDDVRYVGSFQHSGFVLHLFEMR